MGEKNKNKINSHARAREKAKGVVGGGEYRLGVANGAHNYKSTIPSLCDLDKRIEFDFVGSLPIAGDRKLLLQGFLGDAKAVTLVPNVRAGVTIPTRAQQVSDCHY
uniref:Uncharacterized protein n=1 Tax=Romanomermis culicivorax TaxID=13658 RepID=A0A915HMS5_ROMCU